MHIPDDIDILVSEVGPRDGLQSVKASMPTALKIEWLSALAASGLREIEIGSFVSAGEAVPWRHEQGRRHGPL